MEQEIFNIHELIEIKWGIKIIIDASDQTANALANDKLYQKVSFLCEQEKTRLKCLFPGKKWNEVKDVIAKSESRCSEMHRNAMLAWNAVSEIRNIQKTSFEQWLQNGKSFK